METDGSAVRRGDGAVWALRDQARRRLKELVGEGKLVERGADKQSTYVGGAGKT